MAVQFNTWAPGQVITAEKLNQMEEHIGESNALVQTEMDNMTSMQEALGFVPEYALVTTVGGTIDAEGNYTPNNLVNPTFTNFFKVPKSGKILISWEQNVNNKQVGGTNRFAAYIWDSTQSTYLGFIDEQIPSGENGSIIFPDDIGSEIAVEPGMWVRFSYPSTTEKYVVGISFSDYHKIDAHYKSGFSPEDFFNLPVEEMILKAVQFAISFKSQSVGIRKIITAAIQALKTIKLTNAKFQKILDEHIETLNMLNSFISFVFSFEFDSKELCATGFKAVSETLLKGVDLNKKLEESRAKVLHFMKEVLKPMLDQLGGADAAKATNFDDISIAIAAPKYENGVIQNIHLPGLTKSFVSKMFE